MTTRPYDSLMRHAPDEFPRIPRPGSRAARAPGTGTTDPYVTGHGTDAYRVLRYELELDYKLASNRLIGRAVLRAVAARTTSAVVLDMTGLRALKIELNGSRVRKVHPAGGAAVVTANAPWTRARNSPWTSATPEIPSRARASGAKWAGRN